MSTPPSARAREEMLRAIDNIVRHAKRSLLDLLEYQERLLPDDLAQDPRVRACFEMVRRRVHNDVSIMKSQYEAVFAIYENGGTIPPFGRSEAELAAGGRGNGRP